MIERRSNYLDENGEQVDFLDSPEQQQVMLLSTIKHVKRGLGSYAVRRIMENPQRLDELFLYAPEEPLQQAGVITKDILDTSSTYLDTIADAVQTGEVFTADRKYHVAGQGSVRHTFTSPDQHITVTRLHNERPDQLDAEFSGTVTYQPDNGPMVSMTHSLTRIYAHKEEFAYVQESLTLPRALSFTISNSARSEPETKVILGGMPSEYRAQQEQWKHERALENLQAVADDLHAAQDTLAEVVQTRRDSLGQV